MPLKAAVQTSPYDLADHLGAADDVRHLVAAAFEDGDPGVITKALGAAARSKGMIALSAETGLSRESLYKALSENGNPEFKTVMKVVRAIGLQITVKDAAADSRCRAGTVMAKAAPAKSTVSRKASAEPRARKSAAAPAARKATRKA